MLQSIQYGSGPPTYIYSNNATGASSGFFHVFATQMGGYDSRRENHDVRTNTHKREKTQEEQEEYVRECYQREYRERQLPKWNWK